MIYLFLTPFPILAVFIVRLSSPLLQFCRVVNRPLVPVLTSATCLLLALFLAIGYRQCTFHFGLDFTPPSISVLELKIALFSGTSSENHSTETSEKSTLTNDILQCGPRPRFKGTSFPLLGCQSLYLARVLGSGDPRSDRNMESQFPQLAHPNGHQY